MFDHLEPSSPTSNSMALHLLLVGLITDHIHPTHVHVRIAFAHPHVDLLVVCFMLWFDDAFPTCSSSGNSRCLDALTIALHQSCKGFGVGLRWSYSWRR